MILSAPLPLRRSGTPFAHVLITVRHASCCVDGSKGETTWANIFSHGYSAYRFSSSSLFIFSFIERPGNGVVENAAGGPEHSGKQANAHVKLAA
jgi:hypothetical protein